MKKSILIGAMLITAALVFTSCENPNNSVTDTPAENTSDQNTGNENPSNQKEQPVTHDENETQENTSDVILPEDFKDCTKTIKVSEIVFSDGTWEWKVKPIFDEETEQGNVLIFESVNNTTTIIKYKSTVTHDYAENFPEELKKLSEEEKTEWLINHNGMFPPDSVSNVSLSGTKVTFTVEVPEEYCKDIKIEEQLSLIPENAIIKENSEKTKYFLKYNTKDINISLPENVDQPNTVKSYIRKL